MWYLITAILSVVVGFFVGVFYIVYEIDKEEHPRFHD
jgi:hypothetical protein